MLNIAICDDDIKMTGMIDTYLEKIQNETKIQMNIDVYFDGSEVSNAIAEGKQYDILFLDIEMRNMNGITAAKNIRQYDKIIRIIYVTSFENYMRESFSVQPFQFLVKPVQEAQFNICFRQVYEDISSGDFFYIYEYKRVTYKIPIKEILYFESDKRKIAIYTKDNIYYHYGKLNKIEETLSSCTWPFFRIHQSYLVSYRHVEKISYDYVCMSNGKEIPISTDRRKKISNQYCSIGNAYYVY